MYKSDLRRYCGQYSKGKFLKYYLRNPVFRYSFHFRKLTDKDLFFFVHKFLYKIFSIIYGYQIERETTIGAGLYIGHHGTIIINGNSTIGKNCNITAGVVIGQTNRGGNKGAPTIGNEVWIGANSVIVGKINIGNNVLIAPCSYVNIDIPSNSIVIGNPAKIISNNAATENYINNKV